MTDDGKSSSVTITLLGVDSNQSKLELVGSAAVKTGDPVTVQVTLLTIDGRPLDGKAVGLKIEPSANVQIESGAKTDAEGKTTITFTSGESGVHVITTASGGVELSTGLAAIYKGEGVTFPKIVKVDAADIPDANLRAALEKALGKNSGDAIAKEDLAKLKRLDAERKEISDITGLEHCTSLETLNLSGNNIKDILALSNLNSLVHLSLSYNEIKVISVLSNLTSLEIFVLFGGNDMLNDESKDIHIPVLKDKGAVVWGVNEE